MLVEKEKEDLETRNEERLHVVNMQLENVQKLLDEALQEKSFVEQEAETVQQSLQADIEVLNEEMQQVIEQNCGLNSPGVPNCCTLNRF